MNIISIVYKYIIYLRDRKAYFTEPGISVNRGHVAVIFLVFLIGRTLDFSDLNYELFRIDKCAGYNHLIAIKRNLIHELVTRATVKF